MENNVKHKKNSNLKTKSTTKKKTNKVNLFAIIVSAIACIGLLCLAVGLVVLVSMLKSKPTLEINDFINSESSIIYDYEGNEIAELGTTIRENISYDDIPNVTVDAFVAVEDSRYFQHNGFDVPRFAKAFLENLRTLSFGQGGSTFTMQLVKNTYFTNDETGEQASRSGTSGIKRKVQEIALAMELEKHPEINKKTIFELYLNKLNFGGNRNIRGIEKASEYYFGKHVSELNLDESALLAGVINAPNAYNPFNNLENATNRRNEVLYLMNYHGYITDEEYALAKTVKVEDLLADETKQKGGNDSTSPYQSYIDEVVSEVYETTGKDPYTTGMKIYTYMNKEIQTVMDSIQNGTYEGIVFPDDEFELASICINNQTGAIVGILGGRNYADGGSLLLNHATEQFKQPGSSIKPILDYVLAFENLGWSTSHVIVDKPIVYPGTSVIISNSNGTYAGQVTLKDALGNSLNTPAIQTLQQVIDAKGSEYVVDYLNAMGFNISLANFDVQCGIGGNKISVSCLQMAAAQGALLNGGQYTKPHTISRIEFLDGKAPITPVYTSVQPVSAEASFMISTLLQSNVSGGYANLMQILIDDYPVYAKTGTTDWADSGVDYGIPVGAIKDAWMIGSTTEYSVATWIGYERAQKDKQSYITLNDYLGNIQGKTTNAILDTTVYQFGTPAVLNKPDGVVGITHILGTYPYAAPIENMDSKYITTGYIKKEYAKLVNPTEATVQPMSADPTISFNMQDKKINIVWPTYPDEKAMSVAEDTMDISLTRSDGSVIASYTGRRLFDYSWVYGPIRYKADIKVNNETVSTVSSETNNNTFEVDALPGSTITACAYYAYENLNLSSSQRCISTTVEDQDVTITIPAIYDELQSYLTGKGAKVTVKEATADASHSDGTFTINDGTDTYTPGSSYTMKQSKLINTTFEITTYKAVSQPMILQKSVQDVNPNITLTITAQNYTGSVNYSCNSNSSEYTLTNNGNGTATLEIRNMSAGEQLVIMAVDSDNKQASLTITIS